MSFRTTGPRNITQLSATGREQIEQRVQPQRALSLSGWCPVPLSGQNPAPSYLTTRMHIG